MEGGDVEGEDVAEEVEEEEGGTGGVVEEVLMVTHEVDMILLGEKMDTTRMDLGQDKTIVGKSPTS